MAASRTFSTIPHMGITSRAVDSQSTKRRALYQPFGRCGALFALCGHSYILGVIHKRRAFYEKAVRQLVTGD